MREKGDGGGASEDRASASTSSLCLLGTSLIQGARAATWRQDWLKVIHVYGMFTAWGACLPHRHPRPAVPDRARPPARRLGGAKEALTRAF